jgi:hypothetical protein
MCVGQNRSRGSAIPSRRFFIVRICARFLLDKTVRFSPFTRPFFPENDRDHALKRKSRLLQRSHRKRNQPLYVGTRCFGRNAKNGHTRGREQSKGRAMRPRRGARAFYPGDKNAGVIFGNRFCNGIGRVAALHDAMHRSLV